MADMLVMCSKGCGYGLNATQEMLDEASKAGVPLSVQHDICPNEDVAPLRHIKITVTAEEIDAEGNPSPLASMGHTAEAKTFTDALPELQRALNDQWSKIVGLASVIDSEYVEKEDDTTSEQ